MGTEAEAEALNINFATYKDSRLWDNHPGVILSYKQSARGSRTHPFHPQLPFLFVILDAYLWGGREFGDTSNNPMHL